MLSVKQLNSVYSLRLKSLSLLIFRNEYDEHDRDFIGGIKRNLESIQKYFPDYSMRLYYHVSPASDFYQKICPFTCSVPNLDLCNVEMIPSVGTSFVTLTR